MAVTGVVVAAVVSFGLGGLAIVIGPRLGIVDLPDDDLKPHRGRPVPLGGAGVLAGAHVGLAAAGAFDVGLLLATLVVWILGIADDVRGLSPWMRLGGATAGGVLLVVLSDRSTLLLESVAWVAVVVVLVNAVNLLDGIDGLVATVASLALAGLGAFAVIRGTPDPWIATVAVGALLGFLAWNLPPARLFLGDNGSYVVGVVLAWAAMRASPDRGAGVVAVALIGVPLLDLGVTVVRRWVLGKPLFLGDRDHSYDRLRQRGLSIKTVVVVCMGVQAAWMGVILAAAMNWGDRTVAVVAGSLGVLVTVLVSHSLLRSAGR